MYNLGGFLYIRVPKTGSTSFLAAKKKELGGYDRIGEEDHMRLCDFMQTDMWDKYKNYPRIGFVRHPLDWIESIFTMSTYSNRLHWAEFFPGEPYSASHSYGVDLIERIRFTPYDWFIDIENGVNVEIHRTEDLPRNINMNVTKQKLHLVGSKEEINRALERRFSREFEHY